MRVCLGLRGSAAATVNGLGECVHAAAPSLPRRRRGHSKAIFSVAWSPDGRQLASGSGDNTLRVWDAASGACTAVLKVGGGGCKPSLHHLDRYRAPLLCGTAGGESGHDPRACVCMTRTEAGPGPLKAPTRGVEGHSGSATPEKGSRPFAS